MSLQVSTSEPGQLVEEYIKSYGSYVILDRAIPDVRDGLKPVQRRLLWAMYLLGLKPEGGTIKSAKIIGDTIGDLHPHGDAGCYMALCGLATPWSIKQPLVKPQGNFGGLKGEGPAAYRYTEAGLTEFGYAQFQDQKYFSYVPNFDGRVKEPVILSAPLPNFLIEGYGGIALGFAGRVPSHDPLEIAKASLEFVRTGKVKLQGPQLESDCFLLSSEEEIQKVYETGVGTLSYCSAYHIDEKTKTVIVTGYSPQVSGYSIKKSLKDLIDKELVEIEDHTTDHYEFCIKVKDTRLLESRILPALKSKESYRFYGILNENLKLFGVNEVFQVWKEHRIGIFEKRIADQLAIAIREALELQTRKAIIQNYDQYVEALKQPIITKVKKCLEAFIDKTMLDFALDLTSRQILKLEEDALNQKIKAAEKKIQRWTDTTAQKELEAQLTDLIELLSNKNIPLTTKRLSNSDLPRFKSEKSQTHWSTVYDKSTSVETDAPTRGRGFAGISVARCSEYFSFVTEKGWIEQWSVLKLPKRFYFEQYQGKVVGSFGDCGGQLVALDEKSCMHVRANSAEELYKQITKNTKISQILVMTEKDWLVIRYKDGRIKTLFYDKIKDRATTRATGGYEEYKGLLNPAVSIHRAYKGVLYTDQGTMNPDKLAKDFNGKIFNVGANNFVVLKAGNRQILTAAQVGEILDQIETVFALD